MAAGEKEDPVSLDAHSGAGPSHAGRQHGVRQYLGSFGKETDVERMAKLRKENLDHRQQRGRSQERQRKKNEEMAEAWSQRKAELDAEAKGERQAQLARLDTQARERTERKNATSVERMQEEEMDEEYRELLERFGDKVRVPPPPDPIQKTRLENRKPLVPRMMKKPPPVKWGRSKTEGGNSAIGVPSTSSGSVAVPKPTPPSTAARGSVSAAPSGGLPPVTPRRDLGDSQQLAAGDSQMSEALEAILGNSRKDELRQMQQQLSRKTEVSFYRRYMKRHFRRILEVTERTVTDSSARNHLPNWNLAKPLSIVEIKQLSTSTRA